MQDQLEQYYANARVSNFILVPSNPPSQADTTELLTQLSAFVELFLLPSPFIKSTYHEERWDELARRMEAVLTPLRNENKAKGHLAPSQAERLYRHVFGVKTPNRPLTMVSRAGPPFETVNLTEAAPSSS